MGNEGGEGEPVLSAGKQPVAPLSRNNTVPNMPSILQQTLGEVIAVLKGELQHSFGTGLCCSWLQTLLAALPQS